MGKTEEERNRKEGDSAATHARMEGEKARASARTNTAAPSTTIVAHAGRARTRKCASTRKQTRVTLSLCSGFYNAVPRLASLLMGVEKTTFLFFFGGGGVHRHTALALSRSFFSRLE